MSLEDRRGSADQATHSQRYNAIMNDGVTCSRVNYRSSAVRRLRAARAEFRLGLYQGQLRQG
ncbi:MAG: hypothetical protein E6833_38025, partial [Bradyrhizobium sp.]|nr:hypothetical protein [Bradyrhizobium sp.]